MIQVVAIDCGRSSTKGVRDGTREWFPSHVKPWHKMNLERRPARNDMEVEYNRQAWYVGDVARDESGGEGSRMMLRTKAHPDTRLLTLTMASRIAEDGDSVLLVTGTPIERDEAEKARLKQMLYGDHTITVDGTTKHIHFARVEVATECAMAAWSLHRPGTYTVVDPGSRTVNYATIRNARWWDERSGTLNYGTESVQNIGRSQFARMVMADLSRRLREIPDLILMGGAAEVYEEYIREYHAHVEVHPDAFFANAQAFYELGVAAFERAQDQAPQRQV